MREPLDISELLEHRGAKAIEKIQSCFKQMEWPPDVVTQELFDDLKFSKAELVTLRLYTGPVRVSRIIVRDCFGERSHDFCAFCSKSDVHGLQRGSSGDVDAWENSALGRCPRRRISRRMLHDNNPCNQLGRRQAF